MTGATTEAPPGATQEVEEALPEALPPEPTTRSMIIGEVLGSFLLSFLGLGIGVSATLWSSPNAPWFSDIWPTAAGWALAIALGIYVAATLSGAHFNPAVTIALCATGRHPWRLAPLYIGCQILGWFIGAAARMVMFGRNLYDYAQSQNIQIGSPDSTGLAAALTTYSPNPGIAGAGPGGYTTVPFLEGLSGEVLGTGILLLVIFSLLETRHVNAPSAWFFPLIVGSTVGLLIMFVAPISQASFNPARDLGPRIMLYLMGFGSVAFPGPNGGLSLVVTTVGPIIGAVAGAFFFDKVVRPAIPGVEPEPEITQPGQLAYDPVATPRTGTLLGHAPQLPAALLEEEHDIDLVMISPGGAIYDDDRWALAVLRAAREMADGPVEEAEFWETYDARRQAQSGSLSRAVAERFIPGGDADQLRELAGRYVEFDVSALYPDAKPTVAALASRYKLGVVANPREKMIKALRRDGLMQYFTVVASPEQVGARTPQPRMWRRALDEVDVPANRAVHVGNRMDNDVRPAKEAGLHTIWLLRGEAPPSPTLEQLAEPDAIVTTFSGVPNALVGISASALAARMP
jgi:MIP family channel proteins